MGMNPKSDEIIEIGILSFSFTNGAGIINIFDSYNEHQYPGKPIPEEITKVTKLLMLLSKVRLSIGIMFTQY